MNNKFPLTKERADTTICIQGGAGNITPQFLLTKWSRSQVNKMKVSEFNRIAAYAGTVIGGGPTLRLSSYKTIKNYVRHAVVYN